jgi:hypothetical protein
VTPPRNKLVRPSTPIPPSSVSGEVSKAPAKAEDPFEVILPSLSSYHATEIRRWMPRGDDLPKVGDAVLVIVDDVNEPWVVAWWPL